MLGTHRVALTGLRPPGLPHHPAYGSVPGGSDEIENELLPTRSASEAATSSSLPAASPRTLPCFPPWRAEALPGRLACERVASPPQGRGMLHRFSPSWLRDFRFLRFHGHLSAPGSGSTTMASADSCPALTGQVSPGKDAVLPRTTAAFTSGTQPNGFAVWCQLAGSRRPSMRFLFIGSRILPSLLSAERSPGPP